MTQDIRNFFGAKPKPGKVEEQSVMKKKRPKPVVLSSDSDSEDDSKKHKKTVAKKPARQVLSDSGRITSNHVICIHSLGCVCNFWSYF